MTKTVSPAQAVMAVMGLGSFPVTLPCQNGLDELGVKLKSLRKTEPYRSLVADRRAGRLDRESFHQAVLKLMAKLQKHGFFDATAGSD